MSAASETASEATTSPDREAVSTVIFSAAQSSDASTNSPGDQNAVTDLDRCLAVPMFALTLVFLGIAGIAIHLMADQTGRYQQVVRICFFVLLALLPLYLFEALAHWRSTGKFPRQNLLPCLFPPARLGMRDHRNRTQVWLPGFGWQTAGEHLAEDFERKLGYPMIGIAMLILPLLAVEHYLAGMIEANAWLGLATQLAGALIWLAFAAEFIITFSLVPRRLKFIKAHWLDLAIICLPLIAFLRGLRIMRVARLNQLGKTARVFRLRGVTMRAWRAVMLLEVIDRLMHRDPQKRLQLLREHIAEKKHEIEEIQEEIAEIERLLETRPDSAVADAASANASSA